jgi:hypothetical protein
LAEIVNAVALQLPDDVQGIRRVNVVFGRPGQCGGPLTIPVISMDRLRRASTAI